MQAIFEGILFVIAFFVCFYLPGSLFVAKLKYKLTFIEGIFLSSVLGLLIFTLVAYWLSWTNLTPILLPLFVILSFVAIKNKNFLPGEFQKKYISPLLFILIFAMLFSSPLLLNGVFNETIGFRTADDTWHLTLINELKTNFPPDNPGFAGVPLKGYHFFSDFVLAKISNIFYISPLSIYFHFFPLLLSILWGLGVYVLVVAWVKKTSAGLWAVFLTMFGGSFGFIIMLQGHGDFNIDSGMGIAQASSSIQNHPFSISIVILILVLFSLHQYLATRRRAWLFPIILGVGLVSMFKVYAGIILISGFMALAFFEFIRRRYEILITLTFIGLLFLGTYWIFRDPTSTLIFFPFWAPHKVLIDQFPWFGYEEKQYTYANQSVIRGLIEIEVYSLVVFILGNLGTRLIGILALVFFLFKKHKAPSIFGITILLMTLVSFFIPLLFIQSGKVFEIIQLAWYFLFFSSLFASIGFAYLFNFKKKKIIKIVFIAIIAIGTLPSTYSNLSGVFDFTKTRESLNNPNHKAMRYLHSTGNYNQTVLEIPSLDYASREEDLIRWYKESTPKIVAFSNKRSFLNNEYADYYGVDINPRILFLQKVLLFNSIPTTSLNYESKKKELEKELIANKIIYIYSPYPLNSFEALSFIKRIYQDKGVTIYKVYSKG